MGIHRTAQKVMDRFFPRRIDFPSTLIEGDAPRIQDGADYGMPVSLPDYKHSVLVRVGQLQEWLKEAARDTYRFQFDTPGRSSDDGVITPITDDPLREWNWPTRQYVLSNCHAAYTRNPVCKRAVHYVSAFVVGDGFNLTCKNKDVEKYLQGFIDNPDNAIREYERQAVRDLLVDGELFLRYFSGEGETNGEIVVVPLRPWEVQYIETEKGFYRRPYNYHIQPYTQYNTDAPNPNDPVTAYDVDAKDVQHVAINRHSYELRGRPELYAALPWLQAHKQWLENRARQNHWRGALLWWVKIAGGIPSVIAAKVAQYQRPPTPGSIAVTSDKEEWNALTNPVGAGDAGEDGRQLKIMALNALAGIPEYMTGDGENANLATSKSQQLPVLKTFTEFQTIMWEQVWIPMFRRVLQSAIDAGTLPEEVEMQDADGDPVEPPMQMDTEYEDEPETEAEAMPGDGAMMKPMMKPMPMQPKPMQPMMCPCLEAFDVAYEPIGDSEPFTLAQALEIAANNGWISNETASTELGYDYAIEQKKINMERQKDMDAMAQGLKPPPPGMTPDGMGGLEPAGQPAMNGNNGNQPPPPNA